MYITYEEYTALGGTYEIDSPLFNRLERNARMALDKFTFDHIKNAATPYEFEQELKECMVEMIDYIGEYGITNEMIASESNSQGGVSESVSLQKEQSVNPLREIAYTFLGGFDIDGINLFYRGAL